MVPILTSWYICVWIVSETEVPVYVLTVKQAEKSKGNLVMETMETCIHVLVTHLSVTQYDNNREYLV